MSNGNNSLKISLAYTGCFKTFNTASCVRDSCLAILAVITCIICVVKLYKLHSHRHSLLNQYIIFYCGIVECILCGINWFYLAITALHLISQFFKVACQFLVVANFHCCLAARMMGVEDRLKRYSNKIMGAVFLMLMTIVIVGLATMKNEYKECAEPEWLLLSSTEIIIVQVFMISGILITRELNNVRMLSDNRTAQKRDLWGIIFIFQVSALISLVHDIVMRVTGPKNNCQGVFLSNKAGYTAVYITVNITRWLLPLWAMAAIFDTENNECSQDDYVVPVFAVNDNSGNFTSEFRPRGQSFHYKHLQDEVDAAGRPLIPSLGSRSKSLSSMGSSYGSTTQSSNSQRPWGKGTSDRYPPIS
ncbi:uncharacterized protein LOC144644324 [Oculina patagonica]